MTKIKLCGLFRPCDIEAANQLKPDYIGFVFSRKSHRYVSPETAFTLRKLLAPDITAVGVFVDERADNIASLLNSGTIDMAQLHGNEDEDYISNLKKLTDKPLIKAFKIRNAYDAENSNTSNADYILLDSGAGSGTNFDWTLQKHVKRQYFLAGGLDSDNVGEVIRNYKPFAVDVSSSIETQRFKDINKMAAFVAAVRKEELK